MPSSCVFSPDDFGVVRIQLDETIYGRDAVLRTCYWFTDRAYLFVSRPHIGTLEVQLKAKAQVPSLANPTPVVVEHLAGDFLNQLLDNQLRQDIEEKTGRIRELLVAKAFAEAGVLEDSPPGDMNDPVLAAQSSRT